MKLYKDGITRNTDSPAIISELKRAGYEEIKPDEAPKLTAEEKAARKAGKEAATAPVIDVKGGE